MAGIAVATLGTIMAVRGYRSHQIAKGLDKIEQKFLKLKENIPEVQKTFKDVFLRSDISEKETLEILNRYKEVEKISVTGTKEEYIQAVFNEAKRNFGFTDSKFKLKLVQGRKVSKNGETLGGAAQVCNRIQIHPNIKMEEIQGVMHHEMRHMKQNFYAANYNPQAYLHALRPSESVGGIMIKDKNVDPEVLDSIKDDILEIFNLKCFDRNNVPTEHLQYAKKCLEACKTYADGHVDFNSYYNNFKEVDARHAGGLMDKLFHGTVLGGNR